MILVDENFCESYFLGDIRYQHRALFRTRKIALLRKKNKKSKKWTAFLLTEHSKSFEKTGKKPSTFSPVFFLFGYKNLILWKFLPFLLLLYCM